MAIGIQGDLKWSEPADSLGDGVTGSCENPESSSPLKGSVLLSTARALQPPAYIILGGEKVKCTHYHKIDVNVTHNFVCCLWVFETG